ncbi:hypothetical protein GLOIN_2v1765482 [Rhizophagus irregularis DAOM 181602=DAOM 197198]|nr:hypothetical protein GLOIN_2v1765482 [Rhizophagus irregularis DAOM 181602=DAOM 197198]CAB4480153.1 unnamed protein product [Rhizophagus irregularis]
MCIKRIFRTIIMAYLDKKVPELRDICAALGLPKTGKKNDLLLRLEQQQQRQQQQQQQQQESFIKQETNEMQIDSVPIIQQQPQQQQQEVPTSPHVSGTGPSHEHIKYEYESDGLLHAMNVEEIPTEDSSIEQNIPSNVEMSNEYPQSSIDPVEHQQKIDQPPTVSSSVATSPIATQNDVTKVEVSTNFEQNNHDQSKPSESSEKTSSSTYQKDDIRSEIKRELARLMTERKSLNLNSSKMFSRGIMMNQGQTNQGQTNQNKPPPYDYESLLDIMKKSEIYNDGEIPEWLRYDYDTTLGTKKFGESECLRNIGIPAEDFFLPMPMPIVTNVTN